MALVLKIEQESHTADGLVMTVKDTTAVYATGNVGGYGTPNAARNTLALFLIAYNKRYDGSESLVDNLLVVNNYDPLTASTWTLNMQKMGWVNVTVFGLQLYSTSLSFQVGECVYDAGSTRIRKILTKSGASAPYTYTYQNIDTIDLALPASVAKYETVLDTYIITALCSCLQKARKYYFEKKTNEAMQTVREVLAFIDSSIVSFETNAPADGQLKVETAEKICNCLTDKCGC